jgi:hypothetical protein
MHSGFDPRKGTSDMGIVAYVLCAATSGLCAFLSLKGYFRSRVRLLLWMGVCFIGLSLNNLMLLVDMQLMPDVDLSIVRSIPALIGLVILIAGLIFKSGREQ